MQLLPLLQEVPALPGETPVGGQECIPLYIFNTATLPSLLAVVLLDRTSEAGSDLVELENLLRKALQARICRLGLRDTGQLHIPAVSAVMVLGRR